jgi:predicted HAD superfamily Cof-like phosphohydrolase
MKPTTKRTEQRLFEMDELQRECLNQFFEYFNASTELTMWQALVYEEAKELITATTDEERLKEAVDLVYVCTGLLIAMDMTDATGDDLRPLPQYEGLTIKCAYKVASIMMNLVGDDNFDEAFKRVHASNMSKLGSDGKVLRRPDGKILKGPNYKPPVLTDLVQQAPSSTLH